MHSTPVGKKYAVQFEKTDKLMPILDRAKAEGKLVFVDVYTSWCTPCKMMDSDVFTDPALGKFMNKNFINVKINAEKGNGGNVASIFEVYAYPTLLFLDENGRVLARKEGAAYPTEMKRLANNAIAQQGAVGAK